MKTENIKISPRWNRTKDEIWNEIFSEKEEPQAKRYSLWRYAAVAAVLVVALTSFAFLHETRVLVARGEHSTIVLPDGSKVNLNADSRLSYKPYWWWASRDVELVGEGFFEVKAGSRFVVTSGEHQVKVLGTTFNIFARADHYAVSCLTGKVEVSSANRSSILSPNMHASWRKEEFQITEQTDALQAIAWTQNRFSFRAVPLREVVQEIERQYNITVSSDSKLDYSYTGNFSKERPAAEVLEIIGRPFGISFKIEP